MELNYIPTPSHTTGHVAALPESHKNVQPRDRGPLRAEFLSFPDSAHKCPSFFHLQIKLLTIVALIHHTTKAGRILQRCIKDPVVSC